MRWRILDTLTVQGYGYGTFPVTLSPPKSEGSCLALPAFLAQVSFHSSSLTGQ